MQADHVHSSHRISGAARPIAVAMLTITLAIGVAACGSSGSAANAKGSGETTTPSDSGQSAGTEKTTATSTAKAVDVCKVIDAAKASQLTGLAITSAVTDTTMMAKEYRCGYSNDDSSVQVQVSVFEHDAADNYSAILSGSNKDSKKTTAVTGLGDKAFYDNDETLYVLSGDTLIQVNGVDGAEKSAALARPILAAL